MNRFADLVISDVPFSDGKIFIGPSEPALITAGAITRNAAGDVSINIGAAATETIVCQIQGLLSKLLAAGASQGVGADGKYLVTGDSPVAKGVQIVDITVIDLITGAALTAHTIRVDKTVFVNNVAAAISAVLAVGANGLPTATQANPYVTKVPVTSTMDVTDNDVITIEMVATTQGGGAYRWYGFVLHCNYNYA